MADRTLHALVVNEKGEHPKELRCDGPRKDGSRMTGGDVQAYSMPITVRVLTAYDNQHGEASKEHPASVTTRTLLPQ